MPTGRARDLRSGIGQELRRRRLAQRLSQEELSSPFTRAYVSQVERGVTLPSLPALIVMAERLGTSADEVLRAVNLPLNAEYLSDNESG